MIPVIKNKKTMLFICSVISIIFIVFFLLTKNYFILGGFSALTLTVFFFLNKNLCSKIKINPILKTLFWLTIITSFVGPAFLTIPIGSYHIFLFRLFLPLILFLILSQVLLNKGILKISFKKIKFYLLFLVIWGVYAILTIIWASSKIMALRQIYFLFTGFIIIFLIILYIKKQKDFTNFHKLWIFITIGLLGIGLWEVITGNHLIFSAYSKTSIFHPYRFLPSAVFYNTNDFATFLGLTFPFILSWLHYKKGLKNKFLGIGIISVSFYLLVATESRANLLALILELSFLFFFLLNIKRKIKLITVVAIFFIILSLLVPNMINKINNDIYSQINSLGSKYETTIGSDAMRINLIRNLTK